MGVDDTTRNEVHRLLHFRVKLRRTSVHSVLPGRVHAGDGIVVDEGIEIEARTLAGRVLAEKPPYAGIVVTGSVVNARPWGGSGDLLATTSLQN